ncbi:radical SAM/SPASM domain-containing protein [Pseudolabrys taiwanensis]|uniref:Radical SAM/SPASM domain-containing protein n=1 Tax=Pseudolabrys taiwanensis TaxID=331696 RepID=A0A345ZQ48_9HYPH|nr:radical SAM protein [Pseudolabrys taiwanensis]AXK79045.1 radical SAM/SPASM domain-containing protein [Pseudolabrys taiwanensis]
MTKEETALVWDTGEAVTLGERHLSLPAPEPSAGWSAYREQRARALSFDPRRQANFEKYLKTQRTAEIADYLPIKLDIENVSRCNFRCTMCQVSDWPKGQRSTDMPLAGFKRLLDEQYGVIEIKLQGMGEPLLQRDDYFEMLKYARGREIWVRTTTNASLLHLKENYKRLIDCDPNEIQISIDGADKKTFESIRRQSDFDRVISNCKLINDYCAERGVVRTKMWVVVQKGNRHQLNDFVELAAKAGFRSVAFSLNLTDWGQEKWNTINTEALSEDAFDYDLCNALIERGRVLDIKVAFWSVTEKYNQRDTARLCPWPFERVYVSSDMRVIPCCTIGNPDVADLGCAETLTQTWNSETFAAFRHGHLHGPLPAVCRGCYEKDH